MNPVVEQPTPVIDLTNVGVASASTNVVAGPSGEQPVRCEACGGLVGSHDEYMSHINTKACVVFRRLSEWAGICNFCDTKVEGPFDAERIIDHAMGCQVLRGMKDICAGIGRGIIDEDCVDADGKYGELLRIFGEGALNNIN